MFFRLISLLRFLRIARENIPTLCFGITLVLFSLTNVSDARADYALAKAAYDRQDYDTAFRGFKEGADQGDEKSQHMLGVCYLLGKGTARDEVKALEMYQKAAAQGEPRALATLGQAYLRGGIGLEKNELAARSLLSSAAQRGFEPAKKLLASIEEQKSSQTRFEAPTSKSRSYKISGRWTCKNSSFDSRDGKRRDGIDELHFSDSNTWSEPGGSKGEGGTYDLNSKTITYRGSAAYFEHISEKQLRFTTSTPYVKNSRICERSLPISNSQPLSRQQLNANWCDYLRNAYQIAKQSGSDVSVVIASLREHNCI